MQELLFGVLVVLGVVVAFATGVGVATTVGVEVATTVGVGAATLCTIFPCFGGARTAALAEVDATDKPAKR